MSARLFMLTESKKQVDQRDNISLTNVSCGYPPHFSSVLTNLSIAFRTGCVTAIVGCNGSGKSTLMKCLAGLLKLNHGSVSVFGINPRSDSRQWVQLCSYVSQQPTFDHEMTGLEILDYFASLYGLSKVVRQRRVADLIELMNLDDIKFRKISSYSGGNLQKVHLAIGLINDPMLLLCDEPTNNLDAISKHEFWSCVKRLSADDQKTAIVISHDLDFVEQYADVLIVMDHGRILYEGSVDQLIEQAQATDHPSPGLKSSSEFDQPSRKCLFDALSSLIEFDIKKFNESGHPRRGRGRHNRMTGRGKRR